LDGSDRTATTITVRVNASERAYIEGIARRHWVSLSEVIRQHIAAGMEADQRARKRDRSNGRRARRIKVRS